MEEFQHKQPDGTIVHGKRWLRGKPKTGVLILPDIGESIHAQYYDRLGEHLAGKDTAVYTLEHRGHRMSQGLWTLHSFRADIAYWLAHFRSLHKHLYIVATGFSASTMLEYDDQAHTFKGRLPPLPDGMVLLHPVFDGIDFLPRHSRSHKLLQSVLAKHAVERKLSDWKVNFKDPVLFWKEMEGYQLSPVRIQTPSVLFVAMDELSDPLHRIFGSVNIQRVKWLHHGSRALLARHLQDIKTALGKVMEGEKPHRFRALY